MTEATEIRNQMSGIRGQESGIKKKRPATRRQRKRKEDVRQKYEQAANWVEMGVAPKAAEAAWIMFNLFWIGVVVASIVGGIWLVIQVID